MSHSAPSETYSLRDPDNIPRMTVLNENPLGRHNSLPKEEYLHRWNQWSTNKFDPAMWGDKRQVDPFA